MKRLGVAIALAAWLGSCGETRSDGGSGSNTNWLGECASNRDCPRGGECWCNTCVESCTTASDCRASSCSSAVDHGCGAPSQSAELCLLRCETHADCAERGEHLSCVRGACVAGSAAASGGPPLDESALQRLSLAPGFGCLLGEGRVYCWGNNDSGQLGSLPGGAGAKPATELAGLEQARSVAVSRQHACALTVHGDVYCWGLNDQGQLGESSAASSDCSGAGTVPCRPTPARVESIRRAVEIAVIDGRSCARLEAGNVSCWGEDSEAISDWTRTVPDATSLALGKDGACATRADGSLTCSFEIPEYARAWRGLRRVALVARTDSASSAGFGCVLGRLDEVLCFGDDSQGQLGIGEASAGSAAVKDGASSVSLGSAHACALTAGGQVRCWGRNHGGALGAPPYTVPNCGAHHCSRTALATEGLPEAVAIASDSDRNCALTRDGALWCWGIESAGWGPTREPGPWDLGGETCTAALSLVTEQRLRQALEFDSSCEVAEDCQEFSLDLPCDHTCAEMAISRADESVSQLWAGLEASCPAASEGCASPRVACDSSDTRVVCRNGTCDRYDPVRSACDDPCVCDVQRLPNPAFRDECPGFDLQIFSVGNCSTCDRVGLHVAVTNRGTETFSGSATFSFDGSGPLPSPFTTSLTVAPGEVSVPLVFRTDGVGGGNEVYLRVTAAGDCNRNNDSTWHGLVPSSSSVCPNE